jgi:hypothetical protein
MNFLLFRVIRGFLLLFSRGWKAPPTTEGCFVPFVACCAMPFLLSSFTLWKSVQSVDALPPIFLPDIFLPTVWIF